ncbi:MAG: hypothetical protein PHY09_02030 [Desulfuromonadaceae bacterium]|nr:hypothetical protein [Desulfuromonadaceae bacterium]MDD5105101.1 hypothetical protein [Desulfuromonadaceae bacterium]
MKKISILAAALVVTFASVVMAAEVPEDTGGCCACPADPTVTGDVYVGPVSKYLFRGNDLSKSAYGSKSAIQGGIDLTYKEFTLSYWGNAISRYARGNANNQDENGDFASYKRSKVNETDLILDYAIPYKLPFADKLSFNVGTQYFAVDASEDTNEFYLKASYETLLTPTVAVYWDNLAATKAGLFYTAAVSHTIELEHNLFNLNLGALASYNQRNPSAAWTEEGDGVYNGWHNYELTASLDYTPTANIAITPNYMYSNYLSDKAHDLVGIKAQHAVGIKAMFSF